MVGVLCEKVAVVTGAASGQGRAGAVRFATEGAHLVLTDINVAGLEQTAAAVNEVSDFEPLLVPANIADPVDVERVAAAALDRFDAIHVVYNNAGVIVNMSIAQTTEADWDRVHGINLKGSFFIVKSLLEGLKRANGASVVNVSSGAGLIAPNEGMCAYASSKGAVIALTRAQAVDLAQHKIRVNCIVPGVVDTPMSRGWFDKLPAEERDEARDAAVVRAPLRRFGTADEIVNVAVFLAGDESSYVTGAAINVDGGFMAA